MATLRRVGFFDELHKDAGLPSIREAVGSPRHPDEARIVAYLRDGVCLAACGGVQRDVLDPNAWQMTSPDMMSDGVWLWPGELAYYVAKYGVALPAEFVEHARQKGWEVPALSDEESSALWQEVVRSWREQAGQS